MAGFKEDGIMQEGMHLRFAGCKIACKRFPSPRRARYACFSPPDKRCTLAQIFIIWRRVFSRRDTGNGCQQVDCKKQEEKAAEIRLEIQMPISAF